MDNYIQATFFSRIHPNINYGQTGRYYPPSSVWFFDDDNTYEPTFGIFEVDTSPDLGIPNKFLVERDQVFLDTDSYVDGMDREQILLAGYPGIYNRVRCEKWVGRY